ncbi:glycosyltransferase family 39 protein, partial [Pelagibacteraceae bacterium]|nr:glycosyltransferase family 39 protein [Pelagibacteraceae bacterium]
MKNINFFKKENLYIVFLFLFSILINQHYGNKGVFPVDSFAHFDTGFRILLGEHPFKDYWVVSGPLVDYIQALFFYLFGVNWQVYIFHASVFNAIISISTFIILRSFKLNNLYSFIYSLFFSALAYPVSGTPFVDHHSAFFSLMGIYSLILGIKSEKKIYWILLPIFFGFAFLSKQVPSSYVMIVTIVVLTFFSLRKKKYYWVKYSLPSSFIFILFVAIFGIIQKISLTTFLNQYFFYPQTIGAG